MDFVNKGLKSLTRAVGLNSKDTSTTIIIAIVVIGLVILGFYFFQYNNNKGLNLSENMVNDEQMPQESSGVQPSAPLGQNESYASVSGGSSSMPALPSGCNSQPNMDPAELLPSDENSQWASLNPASNGDLQNVNLLKAGANIGIDTVGNSLRNANLQIRSEPANPQLNVGPWMNTTISPDMTRVPLEIGQGPQ